MKIDRIEWWDDGRGGCMKIHYRSGETDICYDTDKRSARKIAEENDVAFDDITGVK